MQVKLDAAIPVISISHKKCRVNDPAPEPDDMASAGLPMRAHTGKP
jgi:hypothetical protein